MSRKIILQNLVKPRGVSVENDIKWICDSLGLINGRDVDGISYKIMCKLLSLFSKQGCISTEKMSKSLKIEPHVINHHVRSLMKSGIVFREKKKIALRGGSLSVAIYEMKRDFDLVFEDLLKVSKRVDDEYDL